MATDITILNKRAKRRRRPHGAPWLRPRGGDQYTGLDRFGRIVDQRWINSTDDDVDRFGYGYDRDSNRLYRENTIDSSLSELYHDGNGYGAARGHSAWVILGEKFRGSTRDCALGTLLGTIKSAQRTYFEAKWLDSHASVRSVRKVE